MFNNKRSLVLVLVMALFTIFCFSAMSLTISSKWAKMLKVALSYPKVTIHVTIPSNSGYHANDICCHVTNVASPSKVYDVNFGSESYSDYAYLSLPAGKYDFYAIAWPVTGNFPYEAYKLGVSVSKTMQVDLNLTETNE